MLHVASNASEIEAAIRKALTDAVFREIVRTAANPYGQGNAGATIAGVLADTDLTDPRLVQKQTIL